MKRFLLILICIQNNLWMYANEFELCEYEFIDLEKICYYESFCNEEKQYIHNCFNPWTSLPVVPRGIFHDFFITPLDQNTANLLYERINSLRQGYGQLQRGDYVSWYEEDGRTHKSSFKVSQETQSRIHVLFINGVKTSYNEFEQHLSYIKKLAPNVNLYGVYNSTKNFEKDIFACHLCLCGIEIPATKILRENILRLCHKISWGEKLIVICHSQGAIHTYNALLKLPYEVRHSIKLLAVAPAKFIPTDVVKDAINIISVDFIPSLQFLYGYTRLNSVVKELISKTGKSMQISDHSFQSPTYKEAIQEFLCRF